MTWHVVHDSRSTFLAAMAAQCAPGRPQGPVPTAGITDDPILDTAAAVLLALLDPGIGLGVHGPAAEAIAPQILAATGAHHAPPDVADFVLVDAAESGAPDLAARGTPDAPERGATLVYCRRGETPVELEGPGLAAPLQTTIALTEEELMALARANAHPPLGVDVFVAGNRTLTALPRSTAVRLGGR